MPDVVVPLDTTKYTRFHRMLSAKNIIIDQNLKYIDSHRKELKKKYKDFDSFKAGFTVPQSRIDAIIAEGEKKDLKPKD